MAWQLQEAKQRFSELVRKTLSEGPQTVSRHGEAVVVVVSLETYRRLSAPTPDFKTYLATAPDLEALELSRAARAAELPARYERAI